MYDALSADYDRFVNWENRLSFEMPFLEGLLRPYTGKAGRPAQVLDAACGTGMHAIALAQRGWGSAGADLSPAMITQARANAATAGVTVPFAAAGFGDLAGVFAGGPQFPFDALLCLGNSLPHLLQPEALATALRDFAACLRPGGLLVIQSRNFDSVLANRERWMEPQAHRSGDQEWLFVRFYDYDPDERITFHILTLHRSGAGGWQQRASATRLWPQRQADLLPPLAAAGFVQVQAFGGLNGAPYNPAESGNLVLTAVRA